MKEFFTVSLGLITGLLIHEYRARSTQIEKWIITFAQKILFRGVVKRNLSKHGCPFSDHYLELINDSPGGELTKLLIALSSVQAAFILNINYLIESMSLTHRLLVSIILMLIGILATFAIAEKFSNSRESLPHTGPTTIVDASSFSDQEKENMMNPFNYSPVLETELVVAPKVAVVLNHRLLDTTTGSWRRLAHQTASVHAYDNANDFRRYYHFSGHGVTSPDTTKDNPWAIYLFNESGNAVLLSGLYSPNSGLTAFAPDTTTVNPWVTDSFNESGNAALSGRYSPNSGLTAFAPDTTTVNPWVTDSLFAYINTNDPGYLDLQPNLSTNPVADIRAIPEASTDTFNKIAATDSSGVRNYSFLDNILRDSSGKPSYRFYLEDHNSHFMTADAAELLNLDPSVKSVNDSSLEKLISLVYRALKTIGDSVFCQFLIVLFTLMYGLITSSRSINIRSFYIVRNATHTMRAF